MTVTAVSIAEACVTTDDGCWEPDFWENAYGYRIKSFEGRDQGAHRIIWQLLVGPIPEGHEIHHECRNRRCCNVEHLECLTVSEHKARHRLTECSYGHQMVGNNVKLIGKSGQRRCRTCANRRQREWRARLCLASAAQ